MDRAGLVDNFGGSFPHGAIDATDLGSPTSGTLPIPGKNDNACDSGGTELPKPTNNLKVTSKPPWRWVFLQRQAEVDWRLGALGILTFRMPRDVRNSGIVRHFGTADFAQLDEHPGTKPRLTVSFQNCSDF